MRSENRQLQSRLKSVVSLERMKEALEKKDSDLTAAQKEAQDKTVLADQKLASVGALEGEVNIRPLCLLCSSHFALIFLSVSLNRVISHKQMCVVKIANFSLV